LTGGAALRDHAPAYRRTIVGSGWDLRILVQYLVFHHVATAKQRNPLAPEPLLIVSGIAVTVQHCHRKFEPWWPSFFRCRDEHEKAAQQNPEGVSTDDREVGKQVDDRNDRDHKRGDKSKVHFPSSLAQFLGATPARAAQPKVAISSRDLPYGRPSSPKAGAGVARTPHTLRK
jgi:hypothetical protein